MIPENLVKEHIIKAIEEVERLGIPKERESEKYDLEYNEKRYPPQYIVVLANKYANGEELDHSTFSGGTEANDFLTQLGFNIVSKEDNVVVDDIEKQEEHDFAPRLKDYLENTYFIKINKSRGRAHLSFPSGSVIHVRGSIILKDGKGFYYLQEEDYKDIVDNTNRFLVVVFGEPENSFVFSKDVLNSLFKNYPLTVQEGKKPKWYFDIREDDGGYFLKIHSAQAKDISINDYLNKWDQIEDFKLLHHQTTIGTGINYWILVVTDHLKEHVTAQQILLTRTTDKFWGLDSRTRFRAMLRKGDKVVFSYGAKKFLGTAILDSDSFELTEEQKNSLSHGQDFFRADFGVTLKDIDIWEEQKSVEKYINSLTFVRRKDQYPAYFQGGIQKISKEDYNIITNISESNVMLSFTDLQRFLLEEMQMQANYQPIMIRTLLIQGGKAAKDTISASIKELSPEKESIDFNSIPVYDVLQKRGIVRKHSNNEFVLNSGELTKEQRQQLIALCNWKIDNMTLQLEELIEAFDKNRTLFSPNRYSAEESERIRSGFVSDFSDPDQKDY